MYRKIFAAAAIATGLVIAAPSAVAAAPSTAIAPSAVRYVALGDSFTSGPLIPTQVDLNCLRSNRNYPSLLSSALGAASFTDVSCAGATTNDILNPGTGQLNRPVPAQLSAVTPDTTLVTVGIGGNDIGFSSIMTTCAEASLSSPLGSPCRDRYTSGGTDQLQERIAATAPKVATVLRAIRAAAPNARVVVLGYVTLLPDSGLGCWPVVPIAYGDVSYLRGIHRSLNAMLANTAAANGAEYVDVYTPSIGRDACKGSGTRWSEPLIPGNSAAPLHPNAAGEQGMANVILAALRA